MNITIIRKEMEEILARHGIRKESDIEPYVMAEYLVDNLLAGMKMLKTHAELQAGCSVEKGQPPIKADRPSPPVSKKPPYPADSLDPEYDRLLEKPLPIKNGGKVEYLRTLVDAFRRTWKGKIMAELDQSAKNRRHHQIDAIRQQYKRAVQVCGAEVAPVDPVFIEQVASEGGSPGRAGRKTNAISAGEEYRELLRNIPSGTPVKVYRYLRKSVEAFDKKWEGKCICDLSSGERVRRQQELKNISRCGIRVKHRLGIEVRRGWNGKERFGYRAVDKTGPADQLAPEVREGLSKADAFVDSQAGLRGRQKMASYVSKWKNRMMSDLSPEEREQNRKERSSLGYDFRLATIPGLSDSVRKRQQAADHQRYLKSHPDTGRVRVCKQPADFLSARYAAVIAGNTPVAHPGSMALLKCKVVVFKERWKNRYVSGLTTAEKQERNNMLASLIGLYKNVTVPGHYLEVQRKRAIRDGRNPDNPGLGRGDERDCGTLPGRYAAVREKNYSEELRPAARSLVERVKAFRKKWGGLSFAELSPQERKTRHQNVKNLQKGWGRLAEPEKHAKSLERRRSREVGKQKQERRLKFMKFEDAMIKGAREMGLDVDQILRQG